MSGVNDATRWVTDHDANHSRWYTERFRRLAAEGADLAGEARLADAMIERGSRVLDAGCGTGRVGAALHARGHVVVGIDADPVLIAAAEADHPGPRWLVADLAGLGPVDDTAFDAAILAGNVLLFVAPETEARVIERVTAQVRPDGLLLVGFGLGRGYELDRFDEDAAAAGLVLEHRFATWDLRPWRADADFAVSALRVPAGD